MVSRGRDKGNAAPDWLAAYLQPWWPGCEKTPNSRPGRDILGTPGVAWEVKTGAEWRSKWVRQSEGYAASGELAVICYLPPGCAERSIGDSLAVVRTRLFLPVLVEAGYAPRPRPRGVADALDQLDGRS